MGVTGRNAVIWLFIADITLTVTVKALHFNLAGKVFFLLALILATAWFKFTFYDMPRAKRKSIEMGLKAIDLLPINKRWANWLTGKVVAQKVVCAYEIHLRLQQMGPRELVKAMEKDLAFIEQNMQGLFLWETSIAVPHRIRKIIRKYESKGRANWTIGSWPIPTPPFTGKIRIKKPMRRGVILIGGD